MMNNHMKIGGRLLASGLLIAGSVLLGSCEKDSDKEDDGGYYIEMVLDAIYVVNTGNAAASKESRGQVFD